ncbi:nucleotidyltransferase domain-containing protein [Patescibacteria group bacterium]|nr:nucleotidyltransferase domain-containing protein [Patescibacteria group bacterium]
MDIFKITRSKIREKILQLFFSDTNKSYYLRELERIIDVPVGTIRREILSLEKRGLFKSERRGNLLYFYLNKKHPFYKELKSIIFKTIGAEGKLKELLKDIKDIKLAFIFGSFAKSKEDSFSDIDLMLIGNPNEDVLISKISSIEKGLGREINYSIFSVKDFKKGLARREVFLEEILKNPKIFIIGDQNVLEKVIGK